MTNILLSIITVLLFARIVLQIWQGKKVVANRLMFYENRNVNYAEVIKNHNDAGYELIQVIAGVTVDGKNGCLLLFTRKKIKNYYEE